MAASLGFPFTAAQWKELERQAMIYKYMVASVPVPYDLLLPISANPASHPPFVGGGGGGGGGSIFSQLRYSTKQDPEPGRCKRTDGKKWRCSRDVAPNQKYCERHMHRGRPRSRKHVENQDQNQNQNQNQTSKKGRLQNPNPPAPSPHQSNHSFPPKVHGSTVLSNESSLFLDNKNIQNLSYKEPNRGLDWMMEGEMVTMDTSEQQWQHLMQQTNLGLTTDSSIYNINQSVFNQDFGVEPLNLYSYTDFGGGSQDFLSSGFVSMERENPRRGFIDAWSNNNHNNDNENGHKETSISSHGNLSPSSLTLSMAMAVGNGGDEEMGRKPDHDLSFSNTGSWVGSNPGGPLAEVLRPSSMAMDSDPASSSYAGNGDQISPAATTVSSPSGVLQRTMLSLSDSSVCNSPTTLAASTARPEIVAFQWLS